MVMGGITIGYPVHATVLTPIFYNHESVDNTATYAQELIDQGFVYNEENNNYLHPSKDISIILDFKYQANRIVIIEGN